jgi:hypothetical protein
VAFKATSSKSKGKKKKDESSEDKDASACEYDDDEALALFMRRFGKSMKKNGYGARKKRDQSKNKDFTRRCYKCRSKDHLIGDCPYNSDNDDADKKKSKKEKKEKKEKKMIIKKNKKGESYMVTWDSDASSSDDDDDDSDDENKASKKKALASIAINNKPSLFDTPSSTCFMAKPTKVQSDDESSDSESDDEEYSREDLMDMLEQAHSYMEKKRKECKELCKKHEAHEQSFDELNASHERLTEAYEKLEKAHSKLEGS